MVHNSQCICRYCEDGITQGLDYTSRYPVIAEELTQLGHDCIIDGEVVVFNEYGKPDFDALQLTTATGQKSSTAFSTCFISTAKI